jgi:arsenate reductase-like glutaredoxin family protein
MPEETDHIMAIYVDAASDFARSAQEFLQYVHLLPQARNAYEEAMAASAELRAVLNTGDENLRTLMAQLEQAISSLSGKALGDKKLEALKAEVMKASAASAGAASSGNAKMLP